MSLWTKFKRRFIRGVIVLLLRIFTRTEITGIEKLRNITGKAIVVSNHLGRLDAAYAFVLIKRDDVILVVAEKYKEQAIFRWLVKHLDLLWLERFGADLGTMKETLRRLEKGGILLIAPEGTRSTTEALLEGKPGATYLASKSGATLIPAAVFGTEDRLVKEQIRNKRRPHIQIIIGEPFTVPALPRENRDEFLRQHTEEIMLRIAALLPEKYHGEYANHPRAAEFRV
jgi:1-acyl-sn-glycerol-3-phosphate acyltransferase